MKLNSIEKRVLQYIIERKYIIDRFVLKIYLCTIDKYIRKV